MDTNRFKQKSMQRPAVPGGRPAMPRRAAPAEVWRMAHPAPGQRSVQPVPTAPGKAVTQPQPLTPAFEAPPQSTNRSHAFTETAVSRQPSAVSRLPAALQPALESPGSTTSTTISIRLSIPELRRLKIPTRIHMTPKRWAVVGLVFWIIFTLGYQMGRHIAHVQQSQLTYAPQLSATKAA